MSSDSSGVDVSSGVSLNDSIRPGPKTELNVAVNSAKEDELRRR